MSLPLVAYGTALAGLDWQPVPTAGFSGAAVWCGRDRDDTPHVALKAYPPNAITRERLALIHGWVEAASSRPFVSVPLRTLAGESFAFAGGGLWEATRWMPGRADFHAAPTPRRLDAACAALAQLHGVWRTLDRQSAPAPGVRRRLQILHDFHHAPPAPPDPLLTRGREQVRRLTPAATHALVPWANVPLPLHPCLCDVWHDHVLFTGDAVTGVIDYGAMKVDHAAVDLARLLGSLVPMDEAAFAAGVEAYRRAGGSDFPADFVQLLAQTGLVCGVAVWCLRAAAGHRLPPAASNRLSELVLQLERLPGFAGPSVRGGLQGGHAKKLALLALLAPLALLER